MESVYYVLRAPGSFGSVRNLRRYSGRSEREAREFLSKQDAYTLHRPRRIRFPRRKTYSMERHKLDCLHFVTLPALAWAMALKYTDAKLDLITDPDIYLTIEGGMRGGIATISKRHAVANNPDVEGYDPTQPNRYITYLDANSLYATAQSQPLPVGDFRILTEQEMSDFDLDSIAADAPTGYILECDIQYPEHLHDLHND